MLSGQVGEANPLEEEFGAPVSELGATRKLMSVHGLALFGLVWVAGAGVAAGAVSAGAAFCRAGIVGHSDCGRVARLAAAGSVGR